MANTYRMRSDHSVEVQNADGSWTAPMPSPQEQKDIDTHVWPWLGLAEDNEARVGIPAAFTLGVIWGESDGNPNAHGPPSDYGIGLMEITAQALKQGLSNDQVFVPENNVRLGTDALASSARIVGLDLPKLASMYNAGGTASGPHLSPGAPWGYREYTLPDGSQPYISKVVRASNYAVQKIAASPSASSFWMYVAGASLLGVAAGVGMALGDRR